MKAKTKNLVFLLIIGLVFPLILNFNINLNNNQKLNEGSLKQSGWYNETSIHVTGATWASIASSNPWCYFDNGVYIIENVTIDASSSPTGSGILIESSAVDFIIRNCTIYNTGTVPSNVGIKLENTSNGTIVNNNFSNNSYGIYLYDCDYNTVSGNIANGNSIGIFLCLCNNNTITGNTANGNSIGINIYYDCDYNTITGNTANGNGIGICIYYSDYNNITGNTAKDNENAGIQFELQCDYNTITENFFVKNAKHAIDFGSVIKIDNKWNSTTIGNYWDNHTGPDANSDGIVDNPYTFIDGPSDMVNYLPIAEDGAPRITIVSPSEGQRFGRDAPTFEIEVVDIYVWEMWYTIDGGLHNYTFTENGIITQSAWDALLDGSVIIRFYAIDIVGNVAFEEVSVLKNVPSGLDPGVITTIVIVSIVGGVAVIAGVYILMKKRATQE